MASITDLMGEIRDASRLLATRGRSDLSLGLINSIAAKISTVSQWDTKTASRMADVVADTDIDNDLKMVLQDACDKRLAVYIDTSVGVSARAASGAPPRDQMMRHVQN